MRLIGCLAWFDEPTHDLQRAIRTFHGWGVTHLVAVDGAYGLFPGGTARSPLEQHLAIMDVCRELCIPLTIHTPESKYRQDSTDWYVIIDADEHVEQPRDIRPLLARAPQDSAEVRFFEPAGGGNPERTFDLRCLFRALPGLTVRNNHHTYVAGTRVLWGFGQEECADLSFLRIIHTTNLRAGRRRALKREYYDDRDTQGIEHSGGCYMCDEPFTHMIRSGFTYQAGVDKMRSSYFQACDKHARRLWYENRSQLPKILAWMMEYAPPDVTVRQAAEHILSHLALHDGATAFGLAPPALAALLLHELSELQTGRRSSWTMQMS